MTATTLAPAPGHQTVHKVGRVLAEIGARDRIQAVILAYDAGLVRPHGEHGQSASDRAIGQERGGRAAAEDGG